MTTEMEDGDAFFHRYNVELERLDTGVRVGPTGSAKGDAMTILDLDGKTIGELPTSIEPAALAAVMLLVEKSFEEGVQTGRALEQTEI